MNCPPLRKGFTIVELLVVVAVIAIMSTVIVFNGGEGRTRHAIRGAYDTIDVALTQAFVLSRSQQTDDVSRQNVHVVFSGASPHTVGIYFDSSVGSAGEYDALDLLEEEYLLKNDVVFRHCPTLGGACVFASENVVFTIPSSGGTFVKRVDGVEKSGTQYFELQLKSETLGFSVNNLGVRESY